MHSETIGSVDVSFSWNGWVSPAVKKNSTGALSLKECPLVDYIIFTMRWVYYFHQVMMCLCFFTRWLVWWGVQRVCHPSFSWQHSWPMPDAQGTELPLVSNGCYMTDCHPPVAVHWRVPVASSSGQHHWLGGFCWRAPVADSPCQRAGQHHWLDGFCWRVPVANSACSQQSVPDNWTTWLDSFQKLCARQLDNLVG